MPVSEQGVAAPTFTKGPWEAVPTDYDDEFDIVSYATEPGLAVAQHVSSRDMYAIAALPDLIGALEAMRKEFRGYHLPYGSKAYQLAGTALAKARGEV